MRILIPAQAAVVVVQVMEFSGNDNSLGTGIAP